MKLKPRPDQIPMLATTAVFMLLYVAASIAYKGFFSWYNVSSLLSDNATLGLAAIGMTFVILSGGIDLSVGAVIALASMLFSVMLVRWNVPALVAIPLVLLAGAGFGASMGSVIRWFRLPPFLVTLAGMFLARGMALVLTEEKRVVISDQPVYSLFSQGDLNLPVLGLGRETWLTQFTLSPPAMTFLAFLVAAIVLANWTRFGRNIYAIGGNESSATLMGLPVGRTQIGVYALSGFCAATGGLIHALGTSAGDASVGHMLELDAIAAVVIGGTLLSGGVGKVQGTLVGVLILGVVSTIPAYQGNLNSFWTKVAIGLLLLAFIGLQKLLQLKASR